jgi:thymidylate synthase ThyX
MQITIRHQLDPEVEAMLQAAYSRTHATIAERVQGMNEEQLKDSLKTYYLGYGHASINQTAFITIYLEGVSILAAKVVQDDQLYNGQESSTRYIPFDEQPLYPAPLPVGNYAEKLMSYYKQVVPIAIEHERIANPGMNERGVRAKAFDYVRCLLPMGVTTQLSWTTSLYSAREGCLRMMASVYPEVVNIAKSLWEKLHKLYPSSFEPIEDVKRLTPQTIDLYRQMANTHAVCCELVEDEDGDYETVATGSIGKPMRVAQWFHQDAHYHWEPALLAALRSRAPRQHIPRRVDMLCTIYGTIPIDLACWRESTGGSNPSLSVPV